MTDVIVYVDRSVVHDGALEDLEEAVAELVTFVDDNEPDILSYDVYFSDDGARMTVVHTHADPASLTYHMDVAGPEFPAVGEFITLESIDVYGRLGEDLIQRLREKASTLGNGTVSVHDHYRGIDREQFD